MLSRSGNSEIVSSCGLLDGRLNFFTLAPPAVPLRGIRLCGVTSLPLRKTCRFVADFAESPLGATVFNLFDPLQIG